MLLRGNLPGLPGCGAAEWLAAAETALGAAHARAGRPCQDASLADISADRAILAVSDGHGGAPHFRSDVGARIACRVAAEALRGLPVDGPPDEQTVAALCAAMVESWQGAVLRHLAEQPFQAAELAAIDPEDAASYRAGEGVERAYGATLIAALCRADFALLLRCGDGECIVADGAGKLSQPVPWHEECRGNVTVSLCDLSADAFRWAVAAAPAAVMCATDGATNNVLDDAGLRRWMTRALLCCADKGPEAMADVLRADARELALRRAGDDVTAAIALSLPGLRMAEGGLRASVRDAAQTAAAERRRRALAVSSANVFWAEKNVERLTQTYERCFRAALAGQDSAPGPETLAGLRREIEEARRALADARKELARLKNETEESGHAAGN